MLGLAVAFIVRVQLEQRCVVLELVINLAVAIVFEPTPARIARVGAAVLQPFPDDVQVTCGQGFSFGIAVVVKNRVALGVNDGLASVLEPIQHQLVHKAGDTLDWFFSCHDRFL